MNFIKNLLSLFKLDPPSGTGLIREAVEDYRNIRLSSFQKPVGAAQMNDVRGAEDTLEKIQIFFDQLDTGTCVPHVISKIFIVYLYKKTGKIIRVSRRWLYKLCKLVDGYNGPGTYPRIAALASVKDGFLTEDYIIDDTSVGEKAYLDFEVTDEMRAEAKKLTFPGFAIVDPTIEAIKEAIYQNGIVSAGMPIGKWNTLPLLPGNELHDVGLYRVEDIGNDHRIYVDNSWGKGWLAKVKNWLFPGRGYFLWSDYKDLLFDIIAFTDIPADILETTKKLPYRFTKELKIGTTDSSVTELQKFLNSEGFLIALTGPGSKGKETSYFGALTKLALLDWQHSKGISSTGYFGPVSIAEANRRLPRMSLVEDIIKVESGGNDQAIGDNHLSDKAYGALQIRQPMVDDINKYLGTTYQAEQCVGNRVLSLKIFETYFKIYAKLISDEDRARAWNGGAGWKSLYGKKGYENYSRSLDIYWAKVKAIINF